MKISIDTAQDSHDEIRKIITMLQHLVGKSEEVHTNEPSAEATSSFSSMFEQPAAKEPEAEPTVEPEQDSNDLLKDLFSEPSKTSESTAKEEPEESERIQLY